MKKLYLFLTALVLSTTALADDDPRALSITASTPAEGSQYETMPNIRIVFNHPEEVGYVNYFIRDLNIYETDPDNSCLMTGDLVKQDDGSWATKYLAMYDIKLLEGHEIDLRIRAYATESDYNYNEPALGVFHIKFYGTAKDYDYSEVQFMSVSPNSGEETVDGMIKATFSGAVETFTATVNLGLFEDQPCTVTSNATRNVWTVEIPESVLDACAGSSITVVAQAIDAEGKVVKGNEGSDENSCLVWTFISYRGCPEFNVTPATGATVEQIDSIKVNFNGANINLSYATDAAVLVKSGNTEVARIEQSDILFNSGFTEADLVLPEAITADGTYQVVFPVRLFMLGEEYSSCVSKEQIVEYTVSNTSGMNRVASVKSQTLFNLAGQQVDANATGVVVMGNKIRFVGK